MILLKCFKLLLVGSIMLPVGLVALSCGILFGSFLISSARNPKESDRLYGITLTFFALLETFVFIGLLIVIVTALII